MPPSKAAEFFFRGKNYNCPASVYCPSEDSYFLAENVNVKKGATVADMGCGCGIQSLNALMKGASKVYAIDVNVQALRATEENCKSAGFSGKVKGIKSDLFEKFKGKADCIIFNPPYVESDGIRFVDLDGGKKGREVLDRFLEQMPQRLSKNGECWFLQTDLNGYAKTREILRKAGVESKIVARKRGFFEELAVFGCWKK
ncbi:MAG TPA: HemK2/MTQ2 family protein methyltransferase [archaeon]|nr:HemK2/MTQ2 family protein methyltransferase [archaeon]